MNPQFWRRKKVFLTGHTGFKGSWLSLWLHRLGAQVFGVSLAPSVDQPSLFELCNVQESLQESQFLDIRDGKNLQSVVQRLQPDIVFHLAAQALVRESYRSPVATFETNVLGTVNVLEAVRVTPSVKVCVNVTTDKCYENKEWLWGYREVDRLGGADPYSASKACSELVTSAYRSSFFSALNSAAIATARAGNVIGGGDWSADRLIPDIVRAATNGETLTVRSPTAVRPWQHVLDPLHGYLILAEKLATHRAAMDSAWNFGPALTAQKSVEGILETFKQQFSPGLMWRIDTTDQPHETHTLRIDSTKSRSLLAWQPRLAVDDSLKWTASWYKQWSENPKVMRNFTLNQIEQFERLSAASE
jgi:CDP-glucose 4,6-dehydratase